MSDAILSGFSEEALRGTVEILEAYMAVWMREPSYLDRANPDHNRQVAQIEALSDISSDIIFHLADRP